MTDQLALRGERFSGRLPWLLLAELVTAVAFGAAGGWVELPYDMLLLLTGWLACLLLAGVALVLAIKLLRLRGRRAGLIAIFVVLGIQPLAHLTIASTSRTFDRWGNQSRFEAARSRYEVIVHVARSRRWTPGEHQLCVGSDCAVVYASDALRVQLSSAGVFGNWEIVAYDPTHSIGLIENPRRNLGPDALRSLFGPFRIGYCEKLSSAYYFCGLG